ncbi:polyketide cyclase/dehydrase/lipid transport protein [Nocardia tenerifensis]|uniref:Polyketide cyclase/dehydrase/lipid transport protein n=1 Tax=Nocardia tenerifensis TaxID=228006 RepID=A0A318KBI9_9NOCA|nr:SRPBCC family protein [Nocardia tenerifensis]PXX71486.1 polyketide cyclase/dehydrase/lipid transport protein [Nocardia tenerifensis]
MLLKFGETATISGDLASIWDTATDVERWSTWDPHLLGSGFEGEFVPGAQGWTRPKGTPKNAKGPFKVTAVDPQRSFATESPMPMGKMLIETRYEPAGPGRVKVSRDVELHGGFVPFFWLVFYRKMRRDLMSTFVALEREAHQRATEGKGR